MSSSPVRNVSINIISDIICPWCWVGERRLTSTLSQLDSTKYKFNINWLPFQLDPTLPTPSTNKHQRYLAKFGAARVAQMLPFMKATGKQVGIDFNYPVDALVGNTFNAHKLVEIGKRQGKQLETMEELFRVYHEQGKDINNNQILFEVGQKVGLRDVENLLLNDNELNQYVQNELSSTRNNRAVNGVPHFILESEGKTVELSGAQDPEYVLNALKKVGVTELASAGGKNAATGVDGAVCSGGQC